MISGEGGADGVLDLEASPKIKKTYIKWRPKSSPIHTTFISQKIVDREDDRIESEML